MTDVKFGNIEFERRVFPRFTLRVPFTYEQDKAFSGQGVTQNASRGGLQVQLQEKVVPQDILKVKLSLAEGDQIKHIAAKARVIWIRETKLPGALYQAGLEFLEISPEDVKYLQRFERLWLEQAS